jgi:homoserine kinase
MEELRIFAPATIANISCGFDVLGLCLDGIGDWMVIRKRSEKGIHIGSISGADLPFHPAQNVAGVAAMTLVAHLLPDHGFEIELEKGIRAGSGLGSSAASAAGAVAGINLLLGAPLTAAELIPFAMEGERLASGAAHADNVAPALMGGITLVRSYQPLDVVPIHVPSELWAVVVHPHIELRTSDARSVLKKTVTLDKAIRQWGNVGGLISGFYTEDYDLIARSLVDEVVEPLRSVLIPGFDAVKAAAVEAGALGCGISGSGPSVFSLCQGQVSAHRVGQAMGHVYNGLSIPHEAYACQVSREGVRPAREGVPSALILQKI